MYGACILPAFQELFREAGREGGGEGGVVVELEDWLVKKEKYPRRETWGEYDGEEGGREGGREGERGGVESIQSHFGKPSLSPSPPPSLLPAGFLIPGSMASAYDEEPWIEKLKEVIR